MYFFFHVKAETSYTISASSDDLWCSITNPQATNSINTVDNLFVGLYRINWHFRGL